uniref:PPM-type phosphatase domain-containing protein n=1 Tax=Wuchereria bancrofti TaxID=6293 RepID=A0A1I8ECY2_WUCBA
HICDLALHDEKYCLKLNLQCLVVIDQKLEFRFRLWLLLLYGTLEVATVDEFIFNTTATFIRQNSMGAFLDKPKTDKNNDQGVAHGTRYAVASMQGWRIDMEDAHVVEISMSSEPPFLNWSFYAVFDGHAGNKAAQHSAENLLKTLLATSQFAQDNERSGTTAICAIVTPSHIVLANLGDSRAVLARKDQAAFGTEDHKPFLPKERDRIVNAGGSVMIQRVNGSLAVSRALGDFEYKAVPGLDATKQLVSPEPDIYTIVRDPKVDEFLLLACDGVYDVMENAEICSFVESRLLVTSDLSSVANQVLDACLSKGSRDNMTIILVCFDAAPKVDQEAVKKEEGWKQKIFERVQEILEDHGKQSHLDAEFIMRELGGEVTQACPAGVSIHAARSFIDSILAECEAKNEKIHSASSSPGRT